jgi:hypothetical protein
MVTSFEVFEPKFCMPSWFSSYVLDSLTLTRMCPICLFSSSGVSSFDAVRKKFTARTHCYPRISFFLLSSRSSFRAFSFFLFFPLISHFSPFTLIFLLYHVFSRTFPSFFFFLFHLLFLYSFPFDPFIFYHHFLVHILLSLSFTFFTIFLLLAPHPSCSFFADCTHRRLPLQHLKRWIISTSDWALWVGDRHPAIAGQYRKTTPVRFERVTPPLTFILLFHPSWRIILAIELDFAASRATLTSVKFLC